MTHIGHWKAGQIKHILVYQDRIMVYYEDDYFMYNTSEYGWILTQSGVFTIHIKENNSHPILVVSTHQIDHIKFDE
ncbi:MAG: hypothetical protein JKY53_14660 [Flavobacteriales bacterium]|nr:hypothetical protein [Flavobacteriales bacterium]